MIRFYMNGTAGKQDGTEISNGDLSNPLVVDGFYPAAGVTVSKTVTVMVRADAGETWKCVQVTVGSTTTDERTKYSISTPHFIRYNYSTGVPLIPSLSDTNQALTITVSANGSETNTPDTTQKLMVIGGIQIGN